jgi:hypothetical protein
VKASELPRPPMGGDAPSRVADQDDVAARPGRQADLGEVVEVDVVRGVEGAAQLPERFGPLQLRQVLVTGQEAEQGPGGAIVVRPDIGLAAPGRVIPAPQVAIAFLARDRAEGQVDPELVPFHRVAEEQVAGSRAHALGDHEQVRPQPPPGGEFGLDAIGLLVDRDDVVAEDQRRLDGQVIEDDPGEVAAQDLQLGGRAVAVAVAIQRELADGLVIAIDEDRALLGGVLRPYFLGQASSLQPERAGQASDTGAGDQCVGHSLALPRARGRKRRLRR